LGNCASIFLKMASPWCYNLNGSTGIGQSSFCEINFNIILYLGARRSVVGWGTMLQTGRLLVQVLDEVDTFSLPNRSGRTMALRSTDPLTEMSTRNLPEGKKWPARRTDNVWNGRMSENVGASASHNPKGLHSVYKDNFTYYPLSLFQSYGW
jgi:hypothetical protein